MLVSHELHEIGRTTEDVVSELKLQLIKSVKYKRGLLSFVVSPKKSISLEFSKKLSEALGSLGLRNHIHGVDEEYNIDSSLVASGVINIINNIHKKPELIRQLNWKREFIAEKDFICVFVVNISEYIDLVERSPDFWDFRNSVLFIESSSSGSNIDSDESQLYFLTERAKFKNSRRRKAIEEIVESDTFELNESTSNMFFEYLLSRSEWTNTESIDSFVERITRGKGALLNEDDRSYLSALFSFDGPRLRLQAMRRAAKGRLSSLLKFHAYLQIHKIHISLGEFSEAERVLRRIHKDGMAHYPYQMVQLYISLYALEMRKGNVSLSSNVLFDLNKLELGEYANYAVLLIVNHFIAISDSSNAAITLSTLDIDELIDEDKMIYLLLKGHSYSLMELESDARATFQKLASESRSSGETYFEVMGLVNIARSYQLDGDYTKANELLSRASEIALQSNKEVVSLIYSTLAYSWERQGSIALAEENYRYAISASLDFDNALESLNSLTKMYMDANDTYKAAETAREAIEISHKALNPQIIARANLHYAMIMLKMGETSGIINKIKKALSFFVQSKENYMQAVCYEYLGRYQAMINSKTQALEFIEKAASMYRLVNSRSNMNVELSLCYSEIALLEMSLGKSDSALESIIIALRHSILTGRSEFVESDLKNLISVMMKINPDTPPMWFIELYRILVKSPNYSVIDNIQHLLPIGYIGQNRLDQYRDIKLIKLIGREMADALTEFCCSK